MKDSHTTSNEHTLICPFCELGELVSASHNFARCDSCYCPLSRATLETLLHIACLPDAAGRHACECGYPEMRRLPDGVYRCPDCCSEVLPIEAPPAA